MLTAFVLQNLHFAINTFVAMVLSWCFWLHFDVWRARRSSREAFKFLGFALLSLSFLGGAIGLESSIFTLEFIDESLRMNILVGTRALGYLLLVIGLFLDPILSAPKHNKSKVKSSEMKAAPAILFTIAGVDISLTVIGIFSLPILSAIVGMLYLYKAIVGFEHHLRKVSFSFLGLSLYELMSAAELFRDSSNVAVQDLVSSFTFFWYITQLVLLISIFILGRWVFTYLLKRVQTQLFIFFSIAVLFISVISAVSFMYFLLGNIQNEALAQLQVNARVLDYSLDSKKDALVSDTEVLSDDQEIIAGVLEDQRSEMTVIATDYLVRKKLRSLIIVDKNGRVLVRGEDPERVGSSVSGSDLFQRGKEGFSATSVTTQEGVLGPEVFLSSVSPIKNGEEVIGAVLATFAIDNAFVDGIKKATGLTTSIYGGNVISSTTLTSEDGHTRRVGVAETNEEVTDTVLGNGEMYLGENNFLNTPYFTAYLPLTDINNVPVGMIFVGEPQVGVLAAAGRSMQGTYVFSGLLWLLSILPSYLIAAYISKQVR